jgi:hypothetical protein
VGPWYLVDGKTLVFADRRSIAAGPKHGLDLDETGARRGGDSFRFVWTGTKADGSAAAETCSDWTVSSSAYAKGMKGDPQAGDKYWTWLTHNLCDFHYGLYCFEQ